jgi:GntR family transcriptional regulator/MocR family aminotransferase
MIILDSGSSAPLYMQIYEQLKEEIIMGVRTEGSRLPSTRYLAQTLTVGRNTVENAYLQLSSEGYVKSRTGSGYYVENIQGMAVYAKGHQSHKAAVEQKRKQPEEPPACPYNFEYGHLSPGYFPLGVWKKVTNKAMSSLTAEDMTRYGDRLGEPGLRTVLADYLRKSRGVSCSEDQIILCSGTDYALSILCQLVRSSYKTVALEDPGYPGARELFINNGLSVLPVGLERDGLNISELEASGARMVYVTPSHQFPSGAVMPIQKRLKLLEWAKRKNGIIIEDDYDSELRYNSRPIPSISSVDSGGNVIYTGTISKALSPSLRISYMVLPMNWMKRYKKEFTMYQCPVSIIQQRIMEEFINSGHWESHLRKICGANKKKHDLLLNVIQEVLGDKVILHGKNAGLHILLESAQGLTETEMIEKAKESGVLVYPVSEFWQRKERYLDNMVFLGFGSITEAGILEGMKQLSKAWS